MFLSYGHGGGGSSIASLLSQLQAAVHGGGGGEDAELAALLGSAGPMLETLSQLNERLALVQNENELSGVRLADLCRTLVNLLPDRHDTPDIMLMAARCMCNLMEALPGSASTLVDTPGCVQSLLEKLMNISYIDCAEQSLLALQKMSRERAPTLLQQGGLAALLTFIEFFPANVQRTCLSTAANLVVRVPPHCMHMVLESIPLMQQKLSNRASLDEGMYAASILYLQRVTHALTTTTSTPMPGSYHRPYGSAGGGAGGSSSSGAEKGPILTHSQIMSRLVQSDLVRTVVDLLRHALSEPSLFPSSALISLLHVLVQLVRADKSGRISEQLLDGGINIVPLLEQIYAHSTGSSALDSKAEASAAAAVLPSASPALSSSPSMRTSRAQPAAAASSNLLNPLLSLAIELLPDPRQITGAMDEPVPAIRQLFGAGAAAAAAASSAASAAPSGAAGSSQPIPIPAPSASRSSSASVARNFGDRLSFLSPLGGGSDGNLSSSPPSSAAAALLDDAAQEQMDAEELAEQERMDRLEAEGGEEDEDEDAHSDEEEHAARAEETDASEEAPPLSRTPPAAGSVAASSAAGSSTPAAAAAASPAQPASPKPTLHDERASFLQHNPEILRAYTRAMLPLLVQTASATSEAHLRKKCVSGLLRLCCAVQDAWLQDASLFPLAPLATCVHGVLGAGDSGSVVLTLQLVDVLMSKASAAFGPQFFREGCIDTVMAIAEGGAGERKDAPSQPPDLSRPLSMTGSPAGFGPSASVSVQQRARMLLQKHFEEDDEEEGDDAAAVTTDPASVSMLPSSPSASQATPRASGTFTPQGGSPSKRKRRFSSCATPIFKRAQQLAGECQALLQQHVQACAHLHACAADAAEASSLGSTLEQIENSLLTCLSGICSCLIGSPGAALLPAAAAALPAVVSPTLTPTPGDTLTIHELFQSGLLDSVLALLFDPSSAAQFTEGTSAASMAVSPWAVTWTASDVAEELALQRRQRLFCHVFFGLPRRAVPSEDATTAEGSEQPPSDVSSGDSLGDRLVKKLVEALESIEPFATRSCGVHPAQALHMFGRPFKVRLTYKPQRNVREEDAAAAAAEETKQAESAEHDADAHESKMDDEPAAASSAAAASSSSSKKKGRASKSAPSSPPSAPRRSARHQQPETAAPDSGSKKTGFAASLSNAVSALKKKVGRSSRPATPTAEEQAAAARATAEALKAQKAAALAAALPHLYQTRTVHIDTLATFASIEAFLQESSSLWELFDRTERVMKGETPYRTEADFAREDQMIAEVDAAQTAAAAAGSKSAPSSRAGSRKKKAGAAAAASASASPPAEDVEAQERAKVLAGIRRAQVQAQPIRVSFRFAPRSSIPQQPSPYQSYSAYRAAAAAPAPPAEDESEWVEIGGDKNLSLFEAIQQYHPSGWHARHKAATEAETARGATGSARVGAAAAAQAARPWSAFELFNQLYDIEFRLERGNVRKAAKQDAGSSTPIATDDALASSKPVPRVPEAVATKLSEQLHAVIAETASGDSSNTGLTGSSGSAPKQTGPLSSLLLLLHSLHHLAHRWSALYSSWPAMVEFFSDNDAAGNGTTGRNLPLPLSVQRAGNLVSAHSQLPSSFAFASSKMSRKLLQQCEDAVLVVGSLLPRWVTLMSRQFPFLFELRARELLLRVSAFPHHPARHLLALHNHLTATQPQSMALNGRASGAGGYGGAVGIRSGGGMQDDAASSEDDDGGDGGDVPRRHVSSFGVQMQSANRYRSGMADGGEAEQQLMSPPDRIPTMKVMARRENILLAARQLFTMHRSSRTSGLRAEFAGEEAVGVGPTLEFFTIISQQLQLKKLHVWAKQPIKAKAVVATKEPAQLTDDHASDVEMKQASESSQHSKAAEEDNDAEAMELDSDQQLPMGTPAASAASPGEEGLRRGNSKRKRAPSLPNVHAHATQAAAAGSASATAVTESAAASGKRAKNADKPSLPDASSPASPSFVPLRGSSAPPPLAHGTPQRMAEFYEMAAIQCPGCKVIEIPYCAEHKQFLSQREPGGSWRCAGPLVPPPAASPSKTKKAAAASSKSKRGRKGKATEEEEEDAPAAAAGAVAGSSASSGASSTTLERLPCLTSTNTISGHCAHCAEMSPPSGTSPPPRRQLKHWRVHQDEIAYVHDAFPRHALLHSHIVLQCAACCCINFPGTHCSGYSLAPEQSSLLVGNRGGQMVNRAQTLQSEKAYRSVTRHVTFACDMAPLQLQPVVLLKRACVDVMQLCKDNSPRLTAPKPDASKTAATGPTASGMAAAAAALPSEAASAPPRPATPSASESKSRAVPESPAVEQEEEEKSGVDEAAPSAEADADAPPPAPAPTVPASSAFDSPESEFVTSSSLYPPPALQRVCASPEQEGGGVQSGSLEWMWLVGRFLGQALMEQRLLDLPLSHALYKQLSATWMAERRYTPAMMCRLGSSHSVDVVVPHVTDQQAPASLVEQASSIAPPPPSLLLPLLLDLLDLEPSQAKPMLKMMALAYHRFSPHMFPLPSVLQSIDGARIEDLSFDWSVPGCPEIELVPGGSELSVTDANVHLWLWMVARQILCEGVLIQLLCMQQGLRVCLDTSALRAFYAHELEELVSGGGSFGSKLLPWDWSEAKLRTAVKFRGGYGPDSPAVRWLLAIMAQFTPQQQRAFTKFITGSPSLPGGQIQALNPPLTIVKIDLKQTAAGGDKEHGESSGAAINLTNSPALQPTSSPPPPPSAPLTAHASTLVLPSVMTCSHALKLPNYPSLEIMREKILVAITEGSQGFTLS